MRKPDSKIDVADVKNLLSRYPTIGDTKIIDRVKIIQTILSRQLTPEQYNGFINLDYSLTYQNATSEEIESALVMCQRIS